MTPHPPGLTYADVAVPGQSVTSGAWPGIAVGASSGANVVPSRSAISRCRRRGGRGRRSVGRHGAPAAGDAQVTVTVDLALRDLFALRPQLPVHVRVEIGEADEPVAVLVLHGVGEPVDEVLG